MLLQNINNYLPVNMTWHSRKMITSSSSPPPPCAGFTPSVEHKIILVGILISYVASGKFWNYTK
jgi:hypothetical protein